MEREKKEVVFATSQEKISLFRRTDIELDILIFDKQNVSDYKPITISKVEKMKRISRNMYVIEDEEHIYYVLVSNDSKIFDTYLGISEEIPQKGERYNMTRLMYSYGSCYEQPIETAKVRYKKKIRKHFYKIRTNHTYYVLINF